MTLDAAVQKYLETVQRFGEPMPLAQFGLAPPELAEMVSAWEEDYHLNRHFELIPLPWMNAGGPSYQINGAEYTGIVFRETIRDVLG